MPHLLHIDSSIKPLEASSSRQLTARAADAWRAANPDGVVTYRDLAVDPLPALDGVALAMRMTDPADDAPEHAAFRALSHELVNEVLAADTIVFGLPLYNYAAPAQVKTWVDHLILDGLSRDDQSRGLLGDRRFIAIHTRGGGYGAGTPREGWDHAERWFEHVLSTLGLEPETITAELTLAGVNPAMASLQPLADESRAAAEQAIDERFGVVAVAA